MQITFLGTGTSQGVPVIACPCKVCQSDDPLDKRLRSSVWIQTAGKSFVIDAGPDFRQQMLREKVQSLDFVLLTHEHKDHIAGLDDIRAYNYQTRQPMDIYAENRVHDAIKREFYYVFTEEKYPGIPKMNLISIENKPFLAENIPVVPIRAHHLRLPVLGFRIGDFTYITDANYIPPDEKEKIKGSKVIVINALRQKKHISHFTLSQAIELLKELAPERAYLTHISHLMGLHRQVSKKLPGFIEMAYDGLKIKV